MLLQTLVQLNILILATPALAGWTLLPLAQPGVVRAACVSWQSRAAEAAAPQATPAEAGHISRCPHPQPAALPIFPVAAAGISAAQAFAFFAAAPAVAVSFLPFPHAARAP